MIFSECLFLYIFRRSLGPRLVTLRFFDLFFTYGKLCSQLSKRINYRDGNEEKYFIGVIINRFFSSPVSPSPKTKFWSYGDINFENIKIRVKQMVKQV